jgi:beta-ureidopropionase / N-carbamoyl-L-amino-acid hydrolase
MGLPPAQSNTRMDDMSPRRFHCDRARLGDALARSASVGDTRPGVRRLALSEADREIRSVFVGWCGELGLELRIDAIGNLFARRPGTDAGSPPVLIGSHLDTQVAAGPYDGALGVIAALELIRVLNDHDVDTVAPVEVVVWTNEEGARFQPPMMGSAVYTGALSLEEALASRDGDGVSVADALTTIGYAQESVMPEADADSYFELHIEQGPILDREGIDIGIVDRSCAAAGRILEIEGETGHAGPTPMEQRKSALVAAAEIVIALDSLGRTSGPHGRSTATAIDAWPNVPGIIPSKTLLAIDYRNDSVTTLDEMSSALSSILAHIGERRAVRVRTVSEWRFGHQTVFDERLAAIVESAANALDLPVRRIRSFAGHDAYHLAAKVPTALLFTPCRDGISHNTREDVDLVRVANAVDVLINSVAIRARPSSHITAH